MSRFCLVLLPAVVCFAAMAGEDALVKALTALDSDALTADEHKRWTRALDDDAWARLREMERADSRAWAAVQTKADWERFRDARIGKLREAMNVPPPGRPLSIEITRTINAAGYRIENLVFDSRPGLPVTANLYLPEPARPKMPGILICHSHHAPKTEGELQDMGANWARAGCMVLVMDQLGHGERRQQPFGGRQDYRSRYYTGMQLHLIGESLTGWMVADHMRGVDVLLSRPGVDSEKIISIGAVAGGGDPSAVTAALDPRIACAVPFNFGGPQPETRFPLPADAEDSFNYAGSGSFESTRNLSLSVRDGFLPYVMVASLAPRALIYGHEFAWDREHDPVWKRLQKVYGFYNATDRLGSTHGFGNVKLRPPEASHCNNVGPAQRSGIYPCFERWFGIPVAKEDKERHSAEELTCLTDATRTKFQIKPVHEVARIIGAERAAAARAALEVLAPDARRAKLREGWARLLGDIEPRPLLSADVRERRVVEGVRVERLVLQFEKNIALPAMILFPTETPAPPPVVVCVAEEGKKSFLKERSSEIGSLLKKGVAVCLLDVRGSGEAGGSTEPNRHKSTTDASATELMLGQTMLGARLRDLRAALAYLRTRNDLDAKRVALWGDSFAAVNEGPFEDQPESKGKWPNEVRPLGAMLALFGALYEGDVRAVLARKGLTGFEAAFVSHFCYFPHDSIVRGALSMGDLCDVAAALAPIPVRLESLVDERDNIAPDAELRRAWAPALKAYAKDPNRVTLATEISRDGAASLAEALQRR